MAKLDMVIKYTSPEWSHQLEAALGAWEFSAAAVLNRERVVADLERLAADADAAAEARGLDESDQALSSEETAAYLAVERATLHVVRADRYLQREYYDVLTLDGVPYLDGPGGPDKDSTAFVDALDGVSPGDRRGSAQGDRRGSAQGDRRGSAHGARPGTDARPGSTRPGSNLGKER
eukprot:CAMPEP_0197587240 /NCGR_PEP_ID=MMETSP1326-20131121/8934_1 /TAXON_ID=1155430 /ORGANISM="Genus nov. species nov., Strain RCC2288" /LENGTH=176 /DNA_ID=CAMNT_0043151943 /DNA_START=9 /DNA_END=539 /DNA_ORIENTATION=+